MTAFDLTPEQHELRALVRRIAEENFRARALEWERRDEFPWPNMKLLASAGILGISVPEEYGGLGLGWLEAALVLEEIGRTCYTTAMAVLGEVGVQTRAIVMYGTDEQKRRFLPKVASGESVCAICITEPDVGSDVASITTKATPNGDGSYVVNGRKTLISRADVADIFLVYVRYGDAPGAGGIGAMLVERDRKGLKVGQGFKTLGGERLFEIEFEAVPLPKENVLLGPGGMVKMLRAFNGQRCLNGSIGVGIAQGALDAAIDYTKARMQFGRAVADNQGIQWILADCATDIEAARALIWRGLGMVESGAPGRYESGVAKLFANEMSLRVTDRVMQMFGGHGYLQDMPAERYLRWARYGSLGGGTPHILRNGIARELLRR
jgi:alkylation response protein AidB-like acyl-CoA dehydrogenase